MAQLRAAVYARVSTKRLGQDPETQLQPLRKYAADRGFTIVKEYVDVGFSGAKNRRPALDAMMADARARRVDIVIVWRFDRFARSTKHLVDALEEFRHLGISFISMTEAVDTASPMGAAMFSIISAMAQLERDIIRERVKAGLDRVRLEGVVRLGRPPCGISPERAFATYSQTGSIRVAARALHVSPATLQRLVATAKATTGPVSLSVAV
jgi:DNA invertase Pin-like site-specific DNA recombinase